MSHTSICPKCLARHGALERARAKSRSTPRFSRLSDVTQNARTPNGDAHAQAALELAP